MFSLRFIIILLSVILLSCEAQNPENLPDSYVKQVDRALFKNYFPKQHRNSFSVSGNSKDILSNCPVVSKGDQYITIDYEFESGVDVKEMALLNVFMHKKECVDAKCEWKAVADAYFLPNLYSNKARFKNYFPKGSYRIWYGFYLKKDSVSEYPRFHKATCYITID